MTGIEREADSFEWAKFVIRNRDENYYSDAYSEFNIGCRDGNPEAEYCLALMYARGQGVEKDYETALYWFGKAYDGKYARAGYFLGKMHLAGLGTAKDPVRAEMYFTEIAEEDARASYELGILYFTNKDFPRDLPRSAAWMKRSAEAGNAEAQFVVGQFYKTGAGVPKDSAEAVRWLRTAALNRHKGAQILLGNMYRTGDCVPMDTEESDRWYDMADGKSNVSERLLCRHSVRAVSAAIFRIRKIMYTVPAWGRP